MRLTSLTVIVLLLPLTASAQNASSAPPEFKIKDNSFLVEEAFNQEPGIVQHIFGFTRARDSWQLTFTQEYPAPGETHQLSYSLAYGALDGEHGFGDTLINYRRQVLEEGPGRPAFAPRVSLVLPTGRTELQDLQGPQTLPGFGFGSVGLQVNLPLSKQEGYWYFHGNGGFTWLPNADSPRLIDFDPSSGRRVARGRPEKVALFSPHFGASGIYRLRAMLNLMIESTLDFVQAPVAPRRTERNAVVVLSPGARGGWNRGEWQIILGAAVPTSWTSGAADHALFGYFSIEGPFKGLPKPSTSQKRSASPRP
jgi:hypothetical protein